MVTDEVAAREPDPGNRTEWQMHWVMIRYTVKRDQVERNLELVRALHEELESTQPGGLRYASFQLEDKVSFVDLVGGPDLPRPLTHLQAFQRFRTTLDARCDEPPIMTELHEISAFHFQ